MMSKKVRGSDFSPTVADGGDILQVSRTVNIWIRVSAVI